MSTTTADPIELYGVVANPEAEAKWLEQMFLAEQLRGDVCKGGRVIVLEGESAGATGEIRRVVLSNDFPTLDYYRREGWSIPLESIVMAHPEPDKMARFHACNEAVDLFIQSWRDAAEAMAEIEAEELWKVAGYPSHRAYWVEKGKQAEAAGLQQVSYERVLQLVGAAKTLERLEGAGINVAPLKTERAVRELRKLPEEQQPAAAAALVAEHQATGRPLTEALTKKVVAEAREGLTYDQVAMMFAPWGTLKHFTPLTPRQRKFRFQYSGEGTGAYFSTLQDAVMWFDAKLKHQPRRQTMGCPTCTHCTWLEADVRCGALDDLVGLTRIWNMPGHCQAYSPGQPIAAPQAAAPDLELTPVEVLPPLTPQERQHARLVASATGRGKEPSEHDENNTPQWLWEPYLLERGLDEYSLDAATNEYSSVPARVKFTKENSALTQSWQVARAVPEDEEEEETTVFLNCPFSMNGEFIPKFIYEWKEGHFTEAIVLDKADTRPEWGVLLSENCTAILMVHGYVAFENQIRLAEGRGNNSANFPVNLYYFGPYLSFFAAAYRQKGRIYVPYRFAE